jgi:hypothetical protein
VNEPDLRLLKIIADLGSTDTFQLDQTMHDLDLAAGGFASKGMAPAPWFGRRDELEALERAGWLTFDYGAAEYHARDQSSPVQKSVFLEVTQGGMSKLEEAEHADG